MPAVHLPEPHEAAYQKRIYTGRITQAERDCISQKLGPIRGH